MLKVVGIIAIDDLATTSIAVSYTHLDVYKRQGIMWSVVMLSPTLSEQDASIAVSYTHLF